MGEEDSPSHAHPALLFENPRPRPGGEVTGTETLPLLRWRIAESFPNSHTSFASRVPQAHSLGLPVRSWQTSAKRERQ